MSSALEPTDFGDGRLEPLANGIWTATTPVRFVGTWFPHVMAVVRLRGGEIVLHSPCRPSIDLIKAIEKLGDVAHVIAPNWFHDLYLGEYRRIYPSATFWGTPMLQREQRALIDEVITKKAQTPWFEEMPHATLSGLLSFDESLFFHKLSRTLIVADLLMNAKASTTTPLGTRLGYKLFGLDGSLKVFPLLRWFGFSSRQSICIAARQVLQWEPESLIVAHGAPIAHGATAQLRDAFA